MTGRGASVPLPRPGAPSEAEVLAAALAALPGMGPARLLALLSRWSPDEAWRRVLAGRAGGALGGSPERAGSGPGGGGHGPGPGRSRGSLLACWQAAARQADLPALAARLAALGVSVRVLGAPGYPPRLAADHEPPAVLFAAGAATPVLALADPAAPGSAPPAGPPAHGPLAPGPAGPPTPCPADSAGAPVPGRIGPPPADALDGPTGPAGPPAPGPSRPSDRTDTPAPTDPPDRTDPRERTDPPDRTDPPGSAGPPDPPAPRPTGPLAAGALDGPTVAIVGTRRCTPYGREVARDLGLQLAEAGVTVVSGLAVGVDGAAHEGVLAAGAAPPVAVVGSGLDVVYPPRHERLWHRVAAAGLLLSEAPLGARPERWRFPARNRIIAALADVVVVVESHRRGGSQHTVDAAVERGRTVMAVPGSVRSPASAGTNALLADGAVPVRDVTDVLVALGLSSATAGRGAPGHAPDDGDLADPTERAVLGAVGWERATLDQVVDRTGLPVGRVATALAGLEEGGRLAREGGSWARSVPPARGRP